MIGWLIVAVAIGALGVIWAVRRYRAVRDVLGQVARRRGGRVHPMRFAFPRVVIHHLGTDISVSVLPGAEDLPARTFAEFHLSAPSPIRFELNSPDVTADKPEPMTPLHLSGQLNARFHVVAPRKQHPAVRGLLEGRLGGTLMSRTSWDRLAIRVGRLSARSQHWRTATQAAHSGTSVLPVEVMVYTTLKDPKEVGRLVDLTEALHDALVRRGARPTG